MIETFPTPEALADAVAGRVVELAGNAIADRGRFTFALSGGSTPRHAYARLAGEDLSHRVDWQLVHVIWGDERCVPPDDPQSNYRMARETLLDRVPIPQQQIHRVHGEEDPGRAAAKYEWVLRALLGSQGEGSPGALDLVLLGMGEDGHTASLFPGQPALHETEHWVVAVPPQGGTWRLSLTPVLLNAARYVCFVVSGASKAAILKRVLEGPFTPEILPAQAIRPSRGRVAWMVDQAAAGRLQTQSVPQ